MAKKKYSKIITPEPKRISAKGVAMFQYTRGPYKTKDVQKEAQFISDHYAKKGHKGGIAIESDELNSSGWYYNYRTAFG